MDKKLLVNCWILLILFSGLILVSSIFLSSNEILGYSLIIFAIASFFGIYVSSIGGRKDGFSKNMFRISIIIIVILIIFQALMWCVLGWCGMI